MRVFTLIPALLCVACMGEGCGECEGSGVIPEPPPTVELIPNPEASEPFARLLHEVAGELVPSDLVDDMMAEAIATDSTGEEVLSDRLAVALVRGRAFFSSLDEAAALRGLASSELLARMILRGTCGPLPPAAAPAAVQPCPCRPGPCRPRRKPLAPAAVEVWQ